MRRAATMIELIVTIVVMGITMAAIPIVLSQSMKSDEFSINQEAILAGATKIGNILTYEWDEKNSEETDLKHVLDVTNGDDELDRYPDNNSSYRIGHFRGTDRRKFFNTQTTASTIGVDDTNESTNPDDIDDFDNRSDTLYINSQADSDYVKDFTLTTYVKYIPDSSNYSLSNISFDLPKDSNITGSTNIKMVEVIIKDNMNNQIIATFRSYATNIGSTKLLHRTFN